MAKQLTATGYLDQETAAYSLQKQFGAGTTYFNDNGNLAISKSVLAKFKSLTQDNAVWLRGERAWRTRATYDQPGRMQD
jgi:hypothetical protein